jgi:hypothetical protein
MSNPLTQTVMDELPGAVDPEQTVIVMHGRPGRELLRQAPPLAAGADAVKNAVEDFTHRGRARPPAGQRLGQVMVDQPPLLIREIRGIRLPCHATTLGSLHADFSYMLSG